MRERDEEEKHSASLSHSLKTNIVRAFDLRFLEPLAVARSNFKL